MHCDTGTQPACPSNSAVSVRTAMPSGTDKQQAARQPHDAPRSAAVQAPDSSGLHAQVIVTNTIPTKAEHIFPELTVLSAANLLGETIWRVYNASSVTSLF